MIDFQAEDKKNIWHPFTPLIGAPDPILVERAEAEYLYTPSGRKIIDAVSSWWVNLHGHSNAVIAAAIAKQATTLEHVIFAGFTHPPAIELSKNLLSILPSNQKKIFFSDNGSTAVEVAIKMALQYWYNLRHRKINIIAIDGAYHGDTFGSMSVGERGMFTAPFQSRLFDVHFIPYPTKGTEAAVLKQFKKLIDDSAAGIFIYEPLVQGAAGMRMYSSELLDELIKEAKARKVICIADEVFTGFGRTGKLFASLHGSQLPDIMAVSKGITGGAMPLGVTSCSEEILSPFETDDFMKTFFHGHSYTANPLACAAANASFQLLTSESCRQAIQFITESHEAFKASVATHPAIYEVRSLGTILAIELKSVDGSSYANPIRKKIYDFFIERDVLLRPLGNTIYVLPPYVMSKQALDRTYDVIREFLSAI
ncbi:adenosylmethionine--8-amino-7-oxononanoate transaminase [Pseudochryseolinea flava]|uniref:Adenosylmethionine-8-amino-7-oxononanoate aminotransferase n=1 Tax=Pseudochryseolinea flava TaxID=2059302 RepID=A0A364XVW9_9BACT|nr:adenosylmethionine--8-amino-7-oxononanoate transaminase [Pseudochryseolinea flava]RAV98273.1 adenosylmethionine--8-amino-7-oxononanoate transaminase [Pseudochryseolinea flava]